MCHCGADRDPKTAVVVTKWAELGAGLDMDDPKWKRLTTEEHVHGRSTITTEPGTVLRLFRDASHDQGWESDPTERNESLLVMEKYRRHLHERGGIFYSSVPGHWRRALAKVGRLLLDEVYPEPYPEPLRDGQPEYDVAGLILSDSDRLIMECFLGYALF
ncbi:predicted protein [Aspergillus nidulans FGSC A4]|uniref:Uncharacterized protein n=1 Tax=Emericella nidulans (strain FGSC A4 / ATCC 38163 / CBS 112.46 / NRRL 194 / M139) TaxID=227321 RepID=Q5B9D8_EMENI|nr:hypothetical protein [Aspergillus nidulans FGSC A4]EAA63413.1 predicted protein [Aspergillus nidulans FGSC A4]CBF83892.1 TPA: conserved hypothetical protein [Aspergillus nidulans FGSC A4]|eukprot:XP_660446.1 predicted protein [Aspergillus nidulans FGSC A4]